MPWINLTIQTDGYTAPCCFAIHEKFPKAKELHTKSTLDFLNNEKLVQLRKEMMSGVLPKTCKKCAYADLISTNNSPREHYNDELLNMLTPSELDDFVESINDEGLVNTTKTLYSVDVRDGNLCNLMCRICSPQFSSRIQAEEKIRFFSKNDFDFSAHPELLTNLKKIYFSGGEPLLSADHFDLLDSLSNTCILTYNTNFTVLNAKRGNILDKWKRFQSLNVLVSLDDIYDRLAYSRHGSDFQSIVENFQQFHDQIGNSYDKISISISLSIFNVLHIDEIVKCFIDLKLVKPDRIYLNRVENHPFSIETFYPVIKDAAYKSAANVKISAVRNQITEYLDHLNDVGFDKDGLIKAMNLIAEKDKLRGENFSKTFPELHKLINDFKI
jgi:MoaA/NifB/PqqE/SkfB family radical SAM enzyme